jgi:hypothetical protein
MTDERKRPTKDQGFKAPPAPKQIVVNPSVPKVQPKNTPDGRDAPPPGAGTR